MLHLKNRWDKIELLFDRGIAMNTIFEAGDNSDAIKMASEILNNNGLVAFPTETVYGLGGNALSKDAAAKIYAAKGRPSDNPLIVHIADTEDVYKLAKNVPEKARMLMEAFWPGPLTIILPKNEIIPDGTTGGLPTVAIRMPSHPIALSLIRESGVYIAAPSANTSGRPSPTNAKHVLEDMDGRIDMILDGGDVGIGIESTIVDLTSAIPTILRPGFITKKMLENIVGEVAIDRAIVEPDPSLRPKAPGMKYTHYAPKGELSVVECIEDVVIQTDASGQDKYQHAKDSCRNVASERVVARINELVHEAKAKGKKVAVIATEETKDMYDCEYVFVAGSRAKGETIAARLYAILRECDYVGADYIYSEAFKDNELGGAIMNRLMKAAGQRVIKV